MRKWPFRYAKVNITLIYESVLLKSWLLSIADVNSTSLFTICDVIELCYIDVKMHLKIFLIDAAVLIVYQIHYIFQIFLGFYI